MTVTAIPIQISQWILDLCLDLNGIFGTVKPYKHLIIRLLSLVALLVVSSIQIAPQQAYAQDVRFYMKFSGANLRTAPSVVSPLLTPIPFDALYPVLGRSLDNTWIQVQVGDKVGWLPAAFGEVQGQLSNVPISPVLLAGSSRNTNRNAVPAYMFNTPRTRTLFQVALKAGRDPRMYTVAGDSNAAWPIVPGLLVGGQFNFAARNPTLRGTIARFDGALARPSVAVGGGFRAADMFDPKFAQKPTSCGADEGVYVCELRQSKASIVFIQLGTGDRFVWRDFEGTLRRMIDTAIASNVLPVLFTKADEMEQYQGGAPMGYVNDVIRKLAAEYQLPWVDFFAATRPLPTLPNPKLPDRPFVQHGLQDEWGYYFHLTEEGRALKLVCMLQMLDVLTR